MNLSTTVQLTAEQSKMLEDPDALAYLEAEIRREFTLAVLKDMQDEVERLILGTDAS